jgi:hypothetical protein
MPPGVRTMRPGDELRHLADVDVGQPAIRERFAYAGNGLQAGQLLVPGAQALRDLRPADTDPPERTPAGLPFSRRVQRGRPGYQTGPSHSPTTGPCP